MTIQEAMLEEIYRKADDIAKNRKQLAGEKMDYYITLEQLERILISFED